MTDTPTTINVSSFQDLDNAIQEIDAGQVLNSAGQQTNDVTINFTGTIDSSIGNFEGVNNTPGDLWALDNPLANVTIEGNGYSFLGNGDISGFRVLDGNATIDNLVVAGAVTQRGGSGSGLGGAVSGRKEVF